MTKFKAFPLAIILFLFCSSLVLSQSSACDSRDFSAPVQEFDHNNDVFLLSLAGYPGAPSSLSYDYVIDYDDRIVAYDDWSLLIGTDAGVANLIALRIYLSYATTGGQSSSWVLIADFIPTSGGQALYKFDDLQYHEPGGYPLIAAVRVEGYVPVPSPDDPFNPSPYACGVTPCTLGLDLVTFERYDCPSSTPTPGPTPYPCGTPGTMSWRSGYGNEPTSWDFTDDVLDATDTDTSPWWGADFSFWFGDQSTNSRRLWKVEKIQGTLGDPDVNEGYIGLVTTNGANVTFFTDDDLLLYDEDYFVDHPTCVSWISSSYFETTTQLKFYFSSQSEPTPIPTSTPTPTVAGTFTSTPSPTVTGTPPTNTPTVTGTPPTATATRTATPSPTPFPSSVPPTSTSTPGGPTSTPPIDYNFNLATVVPTSAPMPAMTFTSVITQYMTCAESLNCSSGNVPVIAYGGCSSYFTLPSPPPLSWDYMAAVMHWLGALISAIWFNYNCTFQYYWYFIISFWNSILYITYAYNHIICVTWSSIYKLLLIIVDWVTLIVQFFSAYSFGSIPSEILGVSTSPIILNIENAMNNTTLGGWVKIILLFPAAAFWFKVVDSIVSGYYKRNVPEDHQ